MTASCRPLRLLELTAMGMLWVATPAGSQEARDPSGPFMDLGGAVNAEQLSVDLGGSRLDFRDLGARTVGLGVGYVHDTTESLDWTVFFQIRRGRVTGGAMDDEEPHTDPWIAYEADVTEGGAGREVFGVAASHAVGRGPLGLTYAVGWQRTSVDLRMQNGRQISPVEFSFEGLDSGYRFEWRGPWVALEPRVAFGDHRIALEISYFRTHYDAEGRWNLRTDLEQPRSFTNDGDGDGWRGSLSYGFELGRGLVLSLQARRVELSLEDGNDRLFRLDGRVIRNNLPEVTWRSLGLRLSIRRSFQPWPAS